MVTPPPLGHFLGETLELAGRLIPAEAGSLLLDEPHRRKGRSPLTFVAAFGQAAERLIGVEVPTGHGIVGHVYASGKTYATGLPNKDPFFFAQVDDHAGFRTRSVIAAPIRLERAVCGVFELVNRKGRASFSERDVALVELIAHYVSRAIMNAVDVIKQNDLAFIDSLTHLRNDRGLEAFLDLSLRGTSDTAVLFCDVDRLKQINDRFGHRMGSEALKRTARAIATSVGNRGIPFRFGGDEFVIVCPGLSMTAAQSVAEDVQKAVRTTTKGPVRDGGALPAVTISIGVASTKASLKARKARARRGARLLAAADGALYRAKHAGRCRVACATPKDDRLE